MKAENDANLWEYTAALWQKLAEPAFDLEISWDDYSAELDDMTCAMKASVNVIGATEEAYDAFLHAITTARMRINHIDRIREKRGREKCQRQCNETCH